MSGQLKRGWGKTKARYCPKIKKVWQQKRDGSVVVFVDMPTYGLEREEMPVGHKKRD